MRFQECVFFDSAVSGTVCNVALLLGTLHVGQDIAKYLSTLNLEPYIMGPLTSHTLPSFPRPCLLGRSGGFCK